MLIVSACGVRNADNPFSLIAPQCVTTLSKLQLPSSILRISPQKNVHFCFGRAARLFRVLGIYFVVPDFIDPSVDEMHRYGHTVSNKQGRVFFDLHRIPIPCFTFLQILANSTLAIPRRGQEGDQKQSEQKSFHIRGLGLLEVPSARKARSRRPLRQTSTVLPS